MQSELKTYRIDGNRFDTLEGFYNEVTEVIIPGSEWGRNLDAFNDILRGGFGTPFGGFRLVWANAAKSKGDLGNTETVRQLSSRLAHCHSTSREHVEAQLAEAQEKKGPTVFEWLVGIIQRHRDIELVLE